MKLLDFKFILIFNLMYTMIILYIFYTLNMSHLIYGCLKKKSRSVYLVYSE